MKSKILRFYYKNRFFKFLVNKIYYFIVTKKRYSKLLNSKKVLELNKYEYSDYSSKEILQKNKLIKLLIHCNKNVPYYQEVFQELDISERIINKDPFFVLSKMPILTKTIVNENWENLISNNFLESSKSFEISTGGSTGTPQKFLFSKNDKICREAHWYRWERFANINRYSGNDKLLYIGMSQEYLNNKSFVNVTMDNILFMSALGMNADIIKDNFKIIKNYSPTYIRGYSSACYLFAKFVKELNLDLKVKAVLTSSDQLHDYMKKEIEETFHCKVYDFYGQNEDIATASQCNEGTYHVNMESNIVEIDESNNIIGTHLEHFLMPLIKYQVNDLGELEKNYKCKCGRHSDVFHEIIGRVDDYLISSSGNKYAAGALNQPMKNELNTIKEIQYIQTDIDNLKVYYVKGQNFDNDTLNNLSNNIKKFTNNEFNLHFEDSGIGIPRLNNGKFRLIIRKFNDKE